MPLASEQSRTGIFSLKRLWPLLFIAAVMALVFALGWHRYLSLQSLAEHRERLNLAVEGHFLAVLAAYVAVYAASVALSLPSGAVLTLAGGFLFGWFWGGLAALFAASTGALIVFLIARHALGAAASAKLRPTLDRLRQGFQENAFTYLLFLRLVPVVPFWLVNLVPGILGVSLSTYLAATVLGIIPGTFAYSIAGSGLDSAIAVAGRACREQAIAEERCYARLDAGDFLTPELIAGFIALGLLALLPLAARRFLTDRR